MSTGKKFVEVLATELKFIQKRRESQPKSHFEQPTAAHLADEHRLQQHALQQQLCGLTISGGGIRSATFGLGILQGLAAEGFLKRIDYISTVSGGGYIGAWLTAWLRHKSIEEITAELRPTWFDQQANAAFEEPGEVQHLRRYSNFLAPTPSIFSLDGWTLIAIFVRNLLLNQLVFVLGAIAFYLLLRAIVELFTLCHNFGPHPVCQYCLLVICGVAFATSVLMTIGFACGDDREVASSDHETSQSGTSDKLRQVWILVAVNIFTAACASLMFVSAQADSWFRDWEAFAWTAGKIATALGAAHGLLGYFIGTHHLPAGSTWKTWFEAALRGVINGIIAGAICGGVMALLLRTMNVCPYKVATMSVASPPLFLVSFVLGNFLQIGLLGKHLNSYERERWSSLNARLLSCATLWFFILGICVFGPWLVFKLTAPNGVVSQLMGWVLGGTWIGATFAALRAGKSVSTSGAKNSYSELIARAGPAIFLVGLLVVLSFGFHRLVFDGYSQAGDKDKAAAVASKTDSAQSDPAAIKYLKSFNDQHPARWITKFPYSSLFLGNFAQACEAFLVSLVLMLISVLATIRLAEVIGVNTFSLHELYALRLIRCYLGAIRHETRTPGLITNYDPADDVQLSELQKRETTGPGVPERATDGPYHILCAALNRQNSGEHSATSGRNAQRSNATTTQRTSQQAAERLSFQDRKAESFVFTADYCGSNSTGYCETKDFAGGISVGTAMAVSGAAVSPNSGYHSSPAVTALLTIFNSRLGAWFGNPGGKKYKIPNPPGWHYIYRELLGNVNAEDDFVFVSDGGHFENMGVYELIRRRCRFIVCVDTWADPDMRRENLGLLVRNVRIDFGVRIEIDVEQTRTTNGRCGSHVAVGKILYGDVHGSHRGEPPVFNDPRYHYGDNEGILVYVKMGLTGDEPNDLLNYQQENEKFPHDPISDQFFNEAQFESYRALGLHTARILLQGDSQRAVGQQAIPEERTNLEVFAKIYDRWLPPPPHLTDSYTHYNEVYGEILAKLRGNANLQLLATELYGDASEQQVAAAKPRTPEILLAERLMVGEMCALLENVWFGIELEKNILHPVHDGWLHVFRHWTSSPTMWRNWMQIQSEFSPATRKFMLKICSCRFDRRLRDLFDELNENPHLEQLCVDFEWINRKFQWLKHRKPRSRAAVEKVAVERICKLLQDVYWRFELEKQRDGDLASHWLGVLRKAGKSKVFIVAWKEIETDYPAAFRKEFG